MRVKKNRKTPDSLYLLLGTSFRTHGCQQQEQRLQPVIIIIIVIRRRKRREGGRRQELDQEQNIKSKTKSFKTRFPLTTQKIQAQFKNIKINCEGRSDKGNASKIREDELLFLWRDCYVQYMNQDAVCVCFAAENLNVEASTLMMRDHWHNLCFFRLLPWIYF